MSITKFAAVAGIVASALVANVAMAATFTNVSFSNGDVTIEGKGASTVNATFRVVVGANEVVERIQTDVLGDNLGPVCTAVGGELGLQQGTHEISLPVKLPPNTGTYTLAVQGSGIYGAFKTVDCTNDIVGSNSFGSALRVVAEGSAGSVGSSGSVWGFGSFAELLAAIIKGMKDADPKPACPPVYTGSNASAVQGWLLSNGHAAPFHAIGVFAPTGFWGNASQTAYAQATAACK